MKSIFSASPSFVHSSDQVIYGISNPPKKLVNKDDSVLLGMLFQETESWSKPGKSYPDGNYAIFRSSKDTVEIACDNLGTRCVWYYFDEKLFIASTSQASIIEFLGDFQFDSSVIPWIISTGSLGPKSSWDKRIKKVPADGSVIVDRDKWRLFIKANSVKFNPKILPYQKQEQKRSHQKIENQESYGHILQSRQKHLAQTSY